MDTHHSWSLSMRVTQASTTVTMGALLRLWCLQGLIWVSAVSLPTWGKCHSALNFTRFWWLPAYFEEVRAIWLCNSCWNKGQLRRLQKIVRLWNFSHVACAAVIWQSNGSASDCVWSKYQYQNTSKMSCWQGLLSIATYSSNIGIGPVLWNARVVE